MTQWDDDSFDQRLRRSLAQRPEPCLIPDLARRARARAGALVPLARHRRWTRWLSIGAAALIAAVIAGVAVFSPGGSLLMFSGVSSSAASVVSSTGGQISGSLQWMLMGLTMVTICIVVLSIWRILEVEDGSGFSLAAESW